MFNNFHFTIDMLKNCSLHSGYYITKRKYSIIIFDFKADFSPKYLQNQRSKKLKFLQVLFASDAIKLQKNLYKYHCIA